MLEINNPTFLGSGFVYSELIALDVEFTKFSGLRASGPQNLDLSTIKNSCQLLNIKNTDSRCFLYVIASHFEVIFKNIFF